MQMLVSSNSSHSKEASLSKPNMGKDLPNEQLFSQIFANYFDNSNLNRHVEEGEIDPSQLFEFHLAEIMSLLSEGNFPGASEQEEANNFFSLIHNAYLEGEQIQGVEKNDLLDYLQQFLQDIEADDSYTSLLSLFLEIPELAGELIVGLQNDIHLNQGVLPAHQDVKGSNDTNSSDNLTKWNTLLNYLSQYLKNEGFVEENKPTPVQNLLLSITQKWSQDKEWLAFLQENVKKEAGRIQLSSLQQPNDDKKPMFVSYLPTSLLTQGNKENGMAHLAEQLTSSSSQKSEITTPIAANNHSLPTMEGEAKEAVIELKEKIQQSAVKSSEAAPQATARFSHLVEDVKGILRNQLSLLKNGEASQLRVRLTPEHLGHLDIRITSMDGKIITQIMTSNKMANDLLDLQINQLRATLTQQGIQVERIEVSQNTNTSQNLLNQEHKQSQQFNQQKERKSNPSKQDEYVDLEEVDENDGNFNYQVSQVNYAV